MSFQQCVQHHDVFYLIIGGDLYKVQGSCREDIRIQLHEQDVVGVESFMDNLFVYRHHAERIPE